LFFIFPFILGMAIVIFPIKYTIYSHSINETLGGTIAGNKYIKFFNTFVGKTKDIDKLKKSKALCYYDPAKAVKEMDGYSWSVPNVLTPFVGNGPEPGRHDNAYINSMQFREDKEITAFKPKNVFRIFITGWSTAYGSGAPSQDSTIGSYLKKILINELTPSTKKEYEVITLANPAWTSTHEMIIIETYLSELNPDMVISFSGNNDVHWSHSKNNIFRFRPYVDQYYWKLINAVYKISGYSSRHDIIKTGSSPIPPDVVASNLERNVKMGSFALSLKQTRYVFILQPTLYATSKLLSPHEKVILEKVKHQQDYFIRCYTEIKQKLNKLHINNLTFIDESDIFKGLTNDDCIFIDSYHFGDRGNEIIAKHIFDDIYKIILQQ